MIRKSWWLAVVLAAAAGCGEGGTMNPDDTNNTIPQTGNAGSVPPSQGGGGAGGGPVGGAAGGAPGAIAYPKEYGKKGAEKPAGDTKEEPKPAEPGKEATEPKKEDEKAEAPKSASVTLTSDEIAQIKKLPEDDQKIALAQLVCPVSDEHLGSMETPVKKVVNGKTIFLCCAGCTKELNKDPAKILAKLSK
jgi:Cu(I)/Ag(I) efflux system membrane fusion protein